ncbi:MAG: hypothetical protein ABIH23_08765 [bacterium]
MVFILTKIAVIVIAAGFCLKTLNALPKDIYAIVKAIRERNKREIWGSVGEALFMWVVTALLIWFIFVPAIKQANDGWETIPQFLRGF